MKLAVGSFDGVHLGHQAILSGADAALTFSNHPMSVLRPDRAPALVMSVDEKVSAIRACGVKDVHVLDFTRELSDLSPEGFLDRVCTLCGTSRESLRVRCGENWRFGCGGRGDAETLRALGIPVEVVPYAVYDKEPVSSTRVRKALADGRLADAEAMLGRPWTVIGPVVSGKGVGRTIGYPTVNVRLDAARIALPCGVYAVKACGALGAANYGYAPTMGERAWREPVLEIHFLDRPTVEPPADGALLSVTFRRFIRAERAFATTEELVAQIAADCAEIRRTDNG